MSKVIAPAGRKAHQSCGRPKSCLQPLRNSLDLWVMGSGVFHPRNIGKALVNAVRAMMTQETPRDAGSISYFSLIALFPAMLIMIAIVDAFLGWLDLHDLVVRHIAALFPGSRAFLLSNLSQLTDPSPALLLSCVAVVLWLSTWIFSSIESALNRAWQVQKQRGFWESRARSIALMVLGGLLLLLSSGLAGVVSAFRSRATDRVPAFAQDQIINWLWSSVLLGSGFIIAIVVFFCVYKLIPDRPVRWQQAISGAVAAAVLWETASYVFVKLLPAFDSQKVYGRAGVFITLLVWVYTSSLIMLFGANFSAQLHQGLDTEAAARADLEARGGRTKLETPRIHRFPLNR